MSGIIVEGNQFTEMNKRIEDGNVHHFFVLQDRTFIDMYEKRARITPTEFEKIPKTYIQSTTGNWLYLKHTYITDCYVQNKLLDPVLYLYDVSINLNTKGIHSNVCLAQKMTTNFNCLFRAKNDNICNVVLVLVGTFLLI